MKRSSKKFPAVLLAAALCVSFMPAGFGTAAASGTIEISTTKDFEAFAASCVLDSFSEGKTFVLTADIPVPDNLIVPSFGGTFDGGGHTISGLRITEDGSAMGLFRYIEEGGIVKNLNLSGSCAPDGSAERCGEVCGVNRGRIISCTVSGAVKGKESCGGIAGLNEESGLIVNCTVRGAVQARNLAGGIAGENHGTILHCENNASVNTNAYDEPIDLDELGIENIYSTEQVADISDVGGIAGFSSGAVQDCVNRGNIGYPHVGYNIGGIIGRQDGYVSGCENYGTINGRKDTAGIVGQAEPYFSLLFSEHTLSKLRTQAEELSALIDGTITDAEKRSDVASSDTDNILDNLADIEDGMGRFLDETDRIINADVDSVNELSSRLTDLIDMVAPAADNFSQASDLLTEALEDLRDAVELMEQAGENLDTGMDELFPILRDLTDIMDSFSDAGDSMNDGIEALQDGMGDEEDMRSAFDDLSEDFNALAEALGELSQAASDAVTALDNFANSPEYSNARSNIRYQLGRMADIAERISDDLENSESDFQAISDILRYGGDYDQITGYLSNIMEKFSDGSVSGLFDCFSSIMDSVSEVLSSTAADNLGNTFNGLTGRLSGSLEDAGNAGRDIGEDTGAIADNTDITSIYDFIDYLKDAGESLSDSEDPLRDIIDNIEASADYFDRAGENLIAAATLAADASDRASQASDKVTEAADRLTATLDYFAGLDKVSFIGADDDLISARDDLGELIEELLDLCGVFSDSTGDTVDVLAEDMRDINDKASEVQDTIVDLIEEMTTDSKDISEYAEDISSQDTAGLSDGKIADCTNYGQVNGDVSVGGIAGSMAIEYDFDPEGDIETVGEKSIDFMYQSKTVVRDCVNYGEVIAKKDGAGGIAGEMSTGCLINCAGLGNVSSTGGSCVGGVAGQSGAAISGCSAMCRLSGGSYVGGIAGECNDMSGCRGFTVIDGGVERLGAIAGACKGDMEDNAFIDSGIGGVDGISYSGKAYPVGYEYMLRMSNVPEEFGSLTLTFVVEDEVVSELKCAYGGSVPEEKLPVIPEKEGCFGRWDEFDFTNVTFGARIEAVYSDYVTALSSAEKRENGLPIVIAEGNFTDEGRLAAASSGEDSWTVALPDDGAAEHTIRYLPCCGADRAEVTVTEGGISRKAAAEPDGSYLVFTVKGTEFGITVTEKASHMGLYLSIAGGAALIAVIVIIIAAHRKRSKK